ncbi:MAG TPA: thiazole tautomerase TenI [Bacillota bacterium]|nr:thiazole tautomerase TenI [Bacillota bacterium]
MGKQLHVISSGKQSVKQFVSIVEKIHPYVNFIHFRERQWTALEHLQAIATLQEKGVPSEKIIINDRVDIAFVTKVAGVQLTHHSLDVAIVRKHFPLLKIGRSVQTKDDAQTAELAGAHWLIHGHIFPTDSKKGITPRGLSSLEKIVENSNVPVIAIGGITPERVNKVIQTGAQGIAVLSGILLADDPEKAAMQYRQALNTGG